MLKNEIVNALIFDNSLTCSETPPSITNNRFENRFFF